MERDSKQETNRARFVRIAENRTNKIIDMIKLLGNLSNQNNYDYSAKDVEKIFGTLDFELKEAKKRFTKVENRQNSRFKLEDK